jgi:nucleoside-diphosphate kinase
MKQNLQKTLALIKPDLYRQTLLLPTVYQKLKDNNFTVLETQIIKWNYHQASQFYKEHEGKFFFERLTGYMTK